MLHLFWKVLGTLVADFSLSCSKQAESIFLYISSYISIQHIDKNKYTEICDILVSSITNIHTNTYLCTQLYAYMFKCVCVYEHLSGIIFFSVALLFLFFLLISLLGRCTLELKISTKDYMESQTNSTHCQCVLYIFSLKISFLNLPTC